MKKLFVLFMLMVTSLSLWATKWEPRNIEKALQDYETFVYSFTQEDFAILLKGRLAVDKSLKRISTIELYNEEGILNNEAVNDIENELQGIGAVYKNIKELSPNASRALGTLLILRKVKTKDVPEVGRFDEVLMKFANLNIYSNINVDLGYSLVQMANDFRSNYESVVRQ